MFLCIELRQVKAVITVFNCFRNICCFITESLTLQKFNDISNIILKIIIRIFKESQPKVFLIITKICFHFENKLESKNPKIDIYTGNITVEVNDGKECCTGPKKIKCLSNLFSSKFCFNSNIKNIFKMLLLLGFLFFKVVYFPDTPVLKLMLKNY
jgi:hypothetical protein